ncbi:Hypothetical protein POVR1_LOCUS439 [uncultured virus]|nr:Hypothetical protein POVR1_LOCUS439 [uncultured virus]
MAAASPVRDADGCETLLKMTRPGTRVVFAEDDTRSDRVKNKLRNEARREDFLKIKAECASAQALRDQDRLVIDLADAIAKMTGLFQKYPQPGLGVSIKNNETGAIEIFRADDVKIMRGVFKTLVQNYELIFKARTTREARPPQDPRDFKGLQFTRVVLTPEGRNWVNNENFGENVKADILGGLKVGTWADTLMSQGIMLRGTLNALMTMALSGRLIPQPKQAPAPKGTRNPRRPPLFEYTPQMLASFDDLKATYDYVVNEDDLRNRSTFTTTKVPNASDDSVLDILKAKYDEKVRNRANLTGKHRNAIPFDTKRLIYPYARSITEWVVLTKADRDRLAETNDDVRDALAEPTDNAVQRDLVREYEVVTRISGEISDENAAAKKRAAAAGKKRRGVAVRR